MNIKKFEARSIKEALEMVKTQLGPDAVILSAKEVTKGFGLGGVKSVEITAAYSENVLKQKQYVQSKMPDHLKSQFDQVAAKLQKEVIKKTIETKIAQTQQAQKTQTFNAPVTQKKYIEIDEETLPVTAAPAVDMRRTPYQQNRVQMTEQVQKAWSNMEVDQLKNEISELKKLMTQFKPVPQSFVQGHPGSELGVHYQLSPYYTELIDKGLIPEVASDILVQAQNQLEPNKLKEASVIQTWIGKYILNSVPVVSGGFEQFHLFMGPSGSGKTTSMVKLASQLLIQHKRRVALISTDTIKVGADQQMKIFSEILNLPFISIRNPQDWNKVIPYLSQVDHVLVDFASFSLRNKEEIHYLQKMMPPVYDSLRTHLVLSAKSKDAELSEMARKYEQLHVDDVIFTALDEAMQFGSIYNFVRQTNKPLFGFGIGAKVPEDFERATAERVVDLILRITQSQQAQEVLV